MVVNGPIKRKRRQQTSRNFISILETFFQKNLWTSQVQKCVIYFENESETDIYFQVNYKQNILFYSFRLDCHILHRKWRRKSVVLVTLQEAERRPTVLTRWRHNADFGFWCKRQDIIAPETGRQDALLQSDICTERRSNDQHRHQALCPQYLSKPQRGKIHCVFILVSETLQPSCWISRCVFRLLVVVYGSLLLVIFSRVPCCWKGNKFFWKIKHTCWLTAHFVPVLQHLSNCFAWKMYS